jgi:hypothetical protein
VNRKRSRTRTTNRDEKRKRKRDPTQLKQKNKKLYGFKLVHKESIQGRRRNLVEREKCGVSDFSFSQKEGNVDGKEKGHYRSQTGGNHQG